MNEKQFLVFKSPCLTCHIGYSIAVKVVVGSGQPHVPLGVDGVVIDPIGDRRNSNATFKDVILDRVRSQDRDGNKACKQKFSLSC